MGAYSDTLKVTIANSVIKTGHLLNSQVSNSYVDIDNRTASTAFAGNELVACQVYGQISDEAIRYYNTLSATTYSENGETLTEENYADICENLAGTPCGIYHGDDPYSPRMKMQDIVSYSVADQLDEAGRLHVELKIDNPADPTYHKFEADKTRLVYMVDGEKFGGGYYGPVPGGICEGTTEDGLAFAFNVDVVEAFKGIADLEDGTHILHFVLSDGQYTTANGTATFESATSSAISAVQLQAEGQRKVYDLQGRRVENPQSGRVYVVDGKKVIVE